jgi:hypothetical protein
MLDQTVFKLFSTPETVYVPILHVEISTFPMTVYVFYSAAVLLCSSGTAVITA